MSERSWRFRRETVICGDEITVVGGTWLIYLIAFWSKYDRRRQEEVAVDQEVLFARRAGDDEQYGVIRPD
jgi:hypothetical protein